MIVCIFFCVLILNFEFNQNFSKISNEIEKLKVDLEVNKKFQFEFDKIEKYFHFLEQKKFNENQTPPDSVEG